VLCVYVTGYIHIRNGARQFEDTVPGACRELQFFYYLFQQQLICFSQHAKVIYLLMRELTVQRVVAMQLSFTCFYYPFPNTAAGFTFCTLHLFKRQAWNLHVHVDAIQQRTGYPVAVALYLFTRAAAPARNITQVAAGTGLRCLFAI
jgi:hypothetical protein